MITVLIVGAGTMRSMHASAYATMPNVQLVGIADINENELMP
ncbi:Gfo/Idh/MocA family oxidoreductase [Paenibacillus sp. N3/727]|nr:Gfo/Idh/MocA family oxidoreductase [Paenibacillus sp. N3/727]UNK16800.1 Gfo/Idh/MocA family oxidoreductase [Paenibacillus sp. N3/727]